MKQYTSDELRKLWKNFYKERGHVDVGAVSLVSDGSTGVLFNVAGMQPLMPYLLGEKHPLGTRLCNVQGCVRTNDIDSVGDKSHVTFFEMMGSWSLGDYFKEERCKWSFELLTEGFGFDVDHLAATVFAGDENAPRDEEGAGFRLASGFKKENIYYLPAEDNWWGLEYGPCGPDSEMFYIADVPACGPNCGPGCSCGKFTEVGNDVFMQYEKHKDGSLTPLKQKNVDTGWGLERILAFLNGTKDVYKTDLFAPIIAYIEKETGKTYGEDEKFTKSMRVLSDHIRTSVMLIGDDAKLVPSNAGAGYVLRRLIRRAVRHGRTLNLGKDNLLKIASMYIDEIYKESYTNLTRNREFVLSELSKEIDRFESTLMQGMKEFRKILDEVKEKAAKDIDGATAFYLFETFGFPIELTIEMAEEENLTVNEEGYKKAMEEAKKKARENGNFSQKLGDSSVWDNLAEDITTEFVGYEKFAAKSEILAIAKGEELSDVAREGDFVSIITKVTPFYATMGGQSADKGTIKTATSTVAVEDTVKVKGGRVAHIGKVTEGTIKCGEKVTLSIDENRRAMISSNHSATHLLQKALQMVLGNHVEQAGSFQDEERTRFDFSHGMAMTAEEIEKVENIVNEEIERDIPVNTLVMSLEEAKKKGAMALFGEKYGESVRVVTMGDFSKELCGGTHVARTGLIRNFKILSESGVAAGTRRIEAITGNAVLKYYRDVEERLIKASEIVKANPSNICDKLSNLVKENKALSSEIESLKSKAAQGAAGDLMSQVKDIKGVKVLLAKVPGADMNSLRDLGDSLKAKMGEGILLLASEENGKVNLVSMATEGAIKSGAHAGNLIKGVAAFVGGGGGGRPNMAQAGGKNPAGIDNALSEAEKVVLSQINQ